MLGLLSEHERLRVGDTLRTVVFPYEPPYTPWAIPVSISRVTPVAPPAKRPRRIWFLLTDRDPAAFTSFDDMAGNVPPIGLAISETARLRASGSSTSFVLYNQRQLMGVGIVKVAEDVDMMWRTIRSSHQVRVVLQ